MSSDSLAVPEASPFEKKKSLSCVCTTCGVMKIIYIIHTVHLTQFYLTDLQKLPWSLSSDLHFKVRNLVEEPPQVSHGGDLAEQGGTSAIEVMLGSSRSKAHHSRAHARRSSSAMRLGWDTLKLVGQPQSCFHRWILHNTKKNS